MVIKGGDHGLDLWVASAAGKTGWRRGDVMSDFSGKKKRTCREEWPDHTVHPLLGQTVFIRRINDEL